MRTAAGLGTGVSAYSGRSHTLKGEPRWKKRLHIQLKAPTMIGFSCASRTKHSPASVPANSSFTPLWLGQHISTGGNGAKRGNR